MPVLMPQVMGNLMPHMLPNVVPLVTGPMIVYLRGKAKAGGPVVRKKSMLNDIRRNTAEHYLIYRNMRSRGILRDHEHSRIFASRTSLIEWSYFRNLFKRWAICLT